MMKPLLERLGSCADSIDAASRRTEQQRGINIQHIEQQLQVRERSIADAEEKIRRAGQELETQRSSLTELQKQLERDVEARRDREGLEEERLQREHQRLLDLQQAVRAAERSSLTALQQRKTTVDEERRDLMQAKSSIQVELSSRKEELDERERQLHLEKEKVLAMRREVETLGQNCRRRVAETEAIVSAERQKLVVDMEVLEQKQRQLQNGLAELAWTHDLAGASGLGAGPRRDPRRQHAVVGGPLAGSLL